MQALNAKPIDPNNLVPRAIRRKVEAVPPKAVVVCGPRCVGKTSLIEQITQGWLVSWYAGGRLETNDALCFHTQDDAVNVLTAAPILVIDDAHKIPDIGTIVKILVDVNEQLQKPCQIFLTSSSPIHLLPGPESAVGRTAAWRLWPFSLHEMADKLGWESAAASLDRFLVDGLMPAAALNACEAHDFLDDYCSGRLLQDFYDLYPEQSPELAVKILTALARRIGAEISYDALARDIGASRDTVEDCIFKLEACSILRTCPAFSSNPACELKRGRKIYIFDNGVLNALIHDFSPFASRADAGVLWENFFFMERVKLHDTVRDFKRMFFWKATGVHRKEPVFLEAHNGRIETFECPVSDCVSSSRAFFKKKHPESAFTVVRPVDCVRIFKDAYCEPASVDQSLADYRKALEGGSK